VFVTLDDATGPVDATFFEDAQGPYAATLFHSWLLLIRGEVRRTGPRGISLRATGCWELSGLYTAWKSGGLAATRAVMAAVPLGFVGPAADQPADVSEEAVAAAAASRSTRPVFVSPPSDGSAASSTREKGTAGGMGRRRILVHPSGFRQSPYADVQPPGEDVKKGKPPRKLWHSSPGSSGG
jgi:error-prone DNA polymerase